jgi:predicted amidohydrolase YtcJ
LPFGLEMGVPVGLGTDGTRVSSYAPWAALYWAVTGKTAGGMTMWQDREVLSRFEVLRLMTAGSAWMSGGRSSKGQSEKGNTQTW